MHKSGFIERLHALPSAGAMETKYGDALRAQGAAGSGGGGEIKNPQTDSEGMTWKRTRSNKKTKKKGSYKKGRKGAVPA